MTNLSEIFFRKIAGAVKRFCLQGDLEETVEEFVQRSAQGKASSYEMFDLWKKVQYQKEASDYLFDVGLGCI